MVLSLFSVFLAILWIVFGTSYFKLNPFIVLFTASFFLAFILGLEPLETLDLIQKGFGKIVQSIGLLILFGTVIGVALESSYGTIALAQGV